MIEVNKFKVKCFFKQQASFHLVNLLSENLYATIMAAETASKNLDSGTRLQTAKASIDHFLNRINTEPLNFIVVSRENGIFAA